MIFRNGGINLKLFRGLLVFFGFYLMNSVVERFDIRGVEMF